MTACDESLTDNSGTYPCLRHGPHNRRKPWWVTVDRALLRWFPSREAAFAAEREAIRLEHPKQNIARPKVTD